MFNVTCCKYAEMYRDMGLGEIGRLLSCQRDATFCEGYDKRMRLKRTQTIMQGAGHCDFHYTLVDEPASHEPGFKQLDRASQPYGLEMAARLYHEG